MKSLVISWILIIGAIGSLAGQSQEQVAAEASLDERIGAQIPLDAEFIDESGNSIQLGNYFQKQPVILVPAYYQCPNLCTVVLNGLLQSVQELKWDAGKQFLIVVVSFDPRESAPVAAAKKRSYLRYYGRPGTEGGWHFLTGKQSQINRLLGCIGYHVVWDEASRQFAHPSTLLVATPGGRVARYFPGIEFPPRELRMALVDASGNRLGNLADRAFLLCFHYNPTTGKYGVVIWRVMQMAGCGTVVLLAGYLVSLVRKEEGK